jgi:hypothetical protein
MTQHVKAKGVPILSFKPLGKHDGSTVEVAVEMLSAKPFRRVIHHDAILLSHIRMGMSGFRWFLWHGGELLHTGRADSIEDAIRAGEREAEIRRLTERAAA